jgi:hypothetical protein
MKPLRRTALTGAIAASLLTGGAVGATVFGTAASTAASTSTPAASTAPNGGPGPAGRPPNGGVFKPNESKAHEAGESAQREAQENAGQVPTVP